MTGIAGFIGFNLANELINSNHNILGIDNFISSYDHKIISKRQIILAKKKIPILESDINDLDLNQLLSFIKKNTENGRIDVIIHLAAWPGVLRSTKEPEKYFKNNISGFMKVAVLTKILQPKKFLYASSSSVYGNLGSKKKCSENDRLPDALNFYALTKQINEKISEQIFLNLELQHCALRFFTVVGPWGRPDMAYWKFADAIKNNEKILLRGEYGGYRDFTSVFDVVEIISKLIETKNTLPSVLNIAKGEANPTTDLINMLSQNLELEPDISYIEREKTEAEVTVSDSSNLDLVVPGHSWRNLKITVEDFANWYSELN